MNEIKQILIVNSPLYESTHSSSNEDYLPPLGIGLLYTVLKERFHVDFIDCLALNWTTDELIGYINNHCYGFICLNIFTTNFLQVKKIIESVQYEPHWIIGGISTKSLYPEIFKWQTTSLVSIVYGDGELIISDIITNSVKQSPILGDNADKRFYKVDSDSVYYNTNISCEVIDRSIFTIEPEINIFGEKEVCIYTSRGCPYNCAYCMAAHSKNRELGLPRHKSIESIIAELKTISELYPEVSAIRIVDDLFLCKEQNFKDACTIFGRYNFKWRAMCHIWSIHLLNDNFVLSDLYDSGCRELFIGIESGSPRVLNEIHKTSSIEIIRESVIRILNSGISVKGYFICGFPNETKQDLDLTYELAKQLSDYAKTKGLHFRNSTFQFRPYYGTELYDKIIAEKNIKYNSLLYRTRISQDINFHIRNKSFNFDSGNYSLVKDDDLHNYIKIMNDLNA